MKIESKMFPVKSDGTFSGDLPDGADVLEWEATGHFMRVIYVVRVYDAPDHDDKEPWRG